jgi:DNA-directed RNA polymerase subunit E'/Rpb7
MFERREMTRVMSIPSKHLQRNIQSSLLSQIKSQVEGRCGIEGYVQPQSSTIIEYSLGRINILQSGVKYRVRFQSDICYPSKGQVLTVPITFRSKIGVHAESTPLRVLLPRDLHIGSEEYDKIQEKDEVEFEVLGSEFKQGDESIFVLGKLIKRKSEGKDEATEPVEETAAPQQTVGVQEEVKTVSFKPPVEEEKTTRRKRRLPPTNLEAPSTLQINVDADGTNS